MIFVVRMILVVTTSLVLALPPGWCCCHDLARLLPGTEAPADHAAPACPRCCHTAPTAPPSDAPTPPQPGKCPCEDRITTPVADTYVKAPDLSTPAQLPLVDDGLQQAGGHTAAITPDASPPGTSPPLNLLHCFWLC